MLFKNKFVPLWNVLGDDYTELKNIYSSQYPIWSCLPPFTVFLSKYFLKDCWKSLGGCSFSVRWKLMGSSVGFFFCLFFNILKQLLEIIAAVRPTTLNHNTWCVHCHEATLVNNVMQKTEIKFLTKKIRYNKQRRI